VQPSPQLFKPFLDLNPTGVADVAMLTIRAVDSQEGKQVTGPASQIHNHLNPYAPWAQHLILGDQASVTMRLCTGLARAEFAFLA